MLTHLAIRNFILIDKLDLDLDHGFSVITGGTGAGKSILLDAILFTFAKKIKRDVLKTGTNVASTTLVFSPSKQVQSLLLEYDVDISDEDLIVKRTFNAAGRSKHLVH